MTHAPQGVCRSATVAQGSGGNLKLGGSRDLFAVMARTKCLVVLKEHPWTVCHIQGTLGLALDKLLEPGQALAGALTMPLHCGVGTRSPTCTSEELGTASGLVLPQPKPGPQFTI